MRRHRGGGGRGAGRARPPLDAWDKLRADWSDEDIEDALALVKDSFLQSELVEAADSLSARLVELLGTWGEAKALGGGGGGPRGDPGRRIRQLAHRLDRLEEILEVYRDQKRPDRRGFDELQRRLMDQGIENEMRPDPAAEAGSRRETSRSVTTRRRREPPAQAGGSPCRTRWTSRAFTIVRVVVLDPVRRVLVEDEPRVIAQRGARRRQLAAEEPVAHAPEEQRRARVTRSPRRPGSTPSASPRRYQLTIAVRAPGSDHASL